VSLSYLRSYLETNNPKIFTSKEISETTGGYFVGRDLTRALSKLNLTPKRSSRRVGAKPKTIYPYDAPTVLEVLQSLDIHSHNLEDLFSMSNAKNALISNTYGIQAGVGMSNAEARFIPSRSRPILYTEEDIAYYHNYWKKNWKESYDFRKCYLFYLSLFDIAEIKECSLKFHGSKKKEYCTTIPKQYLDVDGYPIIKHSLLNKLNLDPEEYPFEIFSTRTISRLVCMLANPTLKWSDNNKIIYEAHHHCRTRNCIDERHISPRLKLEHKAMHDVLKDDHPYNDPTKHFQVVEPKALPQPRKDEIILKWWQVNRSLGPPFNQYNDKLKIDWEDLPPVSIAEVKCKLKEDLNYKGK